MPPTDLHLRWGERIRERRTAAGLSLLELRDLLGVKVTPQSIWNYEQGLRVVPDELRPAFAKALNVPLSDLFSYDEPDAAA